MDADARARVSADLEWYARAAARVGSPLYESLLKAAAADAHDGGIVADLLAAHAHLGRDEAVPLRLMGAVHRLVLEGHAPELAAHYPSVGGRPRGEETWSAFRSTLHSHRDAIEASLHRPVQTNEVGRCAALVGGFLLVARETGLPLRILEVGTSAGLNLRWDRFRYEARGATWGPESPVRLCSFNTQRIPPFDVDAAVVSRRGCDRAPVEPTTADGRLTLMSFVWADQIHRIRLLKAACEVAARVPAEIDRADAPEWLEDGLAAPAPGEATIVFHSMFLQYLDDDSKERLIGTIETAGAAATRSAPVAWLRMEPGSERADVRLTVWPGGATRLVARAGYHGHPVEWLGD